MNVFLYNIGVAAYRAAISAAAPFNEKAALWVKGRKGIWEKINQVKRKKERLVWFHAASLGEFEQGRPVMEALKAEQPNTKILLTFFSPSGYEIRKNYTGADYIFYLPSDSPKNARRFIHILQPDAAIFIKYEFWYNYLHELKNQNIPVYLISAIFRPDQPFFQSWGGLHRKMLGCFTRLFVQDDESARLLESIGVQNVELTGDTRFDRVKQIADAAKKIEKVEQFCQGRPAVVCGSTWPGDEDLIIDYINRYEGPYKWIIAPHETGESHVKAILEKCRKKTARYTKETPDPQTCDVLIIDCIGLLSSVYRYGNISYIGGGFGKGIHNTLEAAIYGIPVIFGPKYQKFKEAVNLIEAGGGFTVNSGQQVDEIFNALIENPEVAETAGANALKYVNSQLGATSVIMNYLNNTAHH